jgi:hypothetical protein
MERRVMENDPKPEREPVTSPKLLMLILGGFAVGFAVGPIFLMYWSILWLAGPGIVAIVIIGHFVLPILIDVITGPSADSPREKLSDTFLSLGALAGGFVLGSVVALQLFKPELS